MTMRILGVDLGLARTGLALSDELHITTRALPNLIPGSRAKDVAALVALVVAEDVGDVVVGLPLLPSGDDSPMTRRVRGFALALATALAERGLHTRVFLTDERGSSKNASARLVSSGVPKARRKGLLDGEAARTFIEDFVDSAGGSAQRVTPLDTPPDAPTDAASDAALLEAPQPADDGVG
jgi:putative Holliday junction resolvase